MEGPFQLSRSVIGAVVSDPRPAVFLLRRIEIPADLQDRHGFEPLGPADGPVKSAIFGANAAGQYGIDLDAEGRPLTDYAGDGLSRLKGEYLAAGHQRDNLFWGWIRTADP